MKKPMSQSTKLIKKSKQNNFNKFNYSSNPLDATLKCFAIIDENRKNRINSYKYES